MLLEGVWELGKLRQRSRAIWRSGKRVEGEGLGAIRES